MTTTADRPSPEMYLAAASYVWGGGIYGNNAAQTLADLAALPDEPPAEGAGNIAQPHLNAYVQRVREVADNFRRMGATLSRPVWLPDARDFADVFAEARLWTEEDGKRGGAGYYCTTLHVKGARAGLSVTPRADVLEAMRRDMIDVPNDTRHFELIDHGHGRTLVVVSYGQIIGSRWVAYINTDTLPAVLRAPAEGR